MKVIIIEDEPLTAHDLAEGLKQLEPTIAIDAILSSVKQASDYLASNSLPDLIFSDIQLGDGLSFEIFKDNDYNIPIIFCTAYDEYALEAFKANGIDYILKPFTNDSLQKTLQKYKQLHQKFSKENHSYENMINLLQKKILPKRSSVLVYQKEKIIPLPVSEIALCYVHNKITLLISFDQQNFIVSQSLDELEEICGEDFYRANRQYLINRKAIKEVSHYYARKLLLKPTVTFKESITVSKEKSTLFLQWLSNS
jgi:DNA-binding LytR/AlgR family response regulator